MIPSDIRLYTWVDVEEVLLRKQQQGEWPEWLVWVRAYWDEVTMGIRPGTQEAALKWLGEVYDPRFQIDSEQEMPEGLIILEAVSVNQRTLAVRFEETDEEPYTPRLSPSLSRPTVLWPPRQDMEPPEVLPADCPPVVAFHSFKGGVGRTTHALALAQAIAADFSLTEKPRVLLVDGDLEAPGISWLFEQRFPLPPVSFADLIALAHGDFSPEAESAIELVADRLANTRIDGIYVLPSFRSSAGVTSKAGFSLLAIKPEHLIQGSKDAFILTNILASLGKALGVDVVLIDLRAGLSELASGLILDPRVYRIFVTTLSAQSVSGTIKLLELLSERSPFLREKDPLPALIFAQVPEDEQHNIVSQENKLLEAAQPFLEEDRDILRVTTPFDGSLVVLPSSWKDVIMRIQRAGIVDAIRPVMEWLPSLGVEPDRENIPSLRSQREKLAELSEKLVYAEGAEVDNFLATMPLRNLASDYRLQVPIAVIVGAKGAGKTYSFLQIVRRYNWQTFANAALVINVQVKAVISPMMSSKNLGDNAQNIVEKVRSKTSKDLGFDEPQAASTIRDYIRDRYQENLHEGQWRDRWLDLIAWNVGFQPNTEGAGKDLTAHLVKKQQQLVVVLDGLEDLFQNFASQETEQTALRALLQEVPEWLSQQPGRPLGILIFVRQDMVLAAIHQNAAQMMARYQSYALKWNREEALRLVAWIMKQAGIMPSIDNAAKLTDMSKEKLSKALVPLWGKKLGSDRSREAMSDRFVIAALSDYNGQIQSRDLVRFLHIAAKKSIDDTYWQDRLLVPTAMREALPECSHKKIEEIEIENTALENIFTKLVNLPVENRKIPFTQEDAELTLAEIKTLSAHGAILREGDEYYLAEIYRFGLKFTQNAGRAKVLSLARRAGLEI